MKVKISVRTIFKLHCQSDLHAISWGFNLVDKYGVNNEMNKVNYGNPWEIILLSQRLILVVSLFHLFWSTWPYLTWFSSLMTSGTFDEMILHWFSDFLIPVTKEPGTEQADLAHLVWLFKDSCTPFVLFLNHWDYWIEIHVHWLHYYLNNQLK